MGRAKQQLMENEENGYSNVPQKRICSNHINDIYFSSLIKKNGIKGKCDYCRKINQVVDLEVIINKVSLAIKYFYDIAENALGLDHDAESGYYGNTYDINDVLDDLLSYNIEESNPIHTDILNSFTRDTVYCRKDPYGNTEDEELKYDWDNFKNIILTKSRYLFSLSFQFRSNNGRNKAHSILDSVGKLCLDLELFRTVKKATKLYRCRQHSKTEKIETANNIASPPTEYAIYPNRMSPSGISMFYCAFDPQTAAKETVHIDLHKLLLTTAVFYNKEDLKLLNLSNLSQKIISPFDEQQRHLIYPLSFLNKFVKDLTKAIEHDGKEHIEYIPTQIVTEYFRYAFEDMSGVHLNGIIYPSSKNIGSDACVLFFDHNNSLNKLSFKKSLLKTKILTINIE